MISQRKLHPSASFQLEKLLSIKHENLLLMLIYLRKKYVIRCKRNFHNALIIFSNNIQSIFRKFMHYHSNTIHIYVTEYSFRSSTFDEPLVI